MIAAMMATSSAGCIGCFLARRREGFREIRRVWTTTQPERGGTTFPAMPALQTMLFDLDGTLIDSIRLILDSYHHTLMQHRLPARSDEDWLRGVGTPLAVQFSEWRGKFPISLVSILAYRENNLKHPVNQVSSI